MQDPGTGPHGLAHVDAVIRLAHAPGRHVVAEGVETTRQRDILRVLPRDEPQGDLFARPLGEAAAVARTAPSATTRPRGLPRLAARPARPDTVIDALR